MSNIFDDWRFSDEELELDVEEANKIAAVAEFWYLIKPEPWMQQAACKGEDPEIFFPNQGKNSRLAKQICASCPVRPECDQYSEETHSEGIWAGAVKSSAKKSAVQDARPQIITITPRTSKDAPSHEGFGTIAARRQTGREGNHRSRMVE